MKSGTSYRHHVADRAAVDLRREAGPRPWVTFVRSLALCVLAVSLTTVVGGCGCGKKFEGASGDEVAEVVRRRKEKREKEAKEDAEYREKVQKRKERERYQREEELARRRMERKAQSNTSAASTARRVSGDSPKRPTAPTVVLPAQLADWQLTDYWKARQYGTPRFVEAVRYYGRNTAGNAKAIALLLNMLAIPGAGEVQEEAIVQALADNGTPAAWKGIEGLLDGTTRAAHPVLARDTALRVLIDRGDSTSEKILLAAVLRSSKSSSPTVRDLARKILEDHGPEMSEGFRVVLAGYSVDPQIPQDQRDLLQEFLLRPDPRNLGAQAIIYRAPATPLALRRHLRGEFLRQSSAAVGLLTDIPVVIEVPRHETQVVSAQAGQYQTAYEARRHQARVERKTAVAAAEGRIDPQLTARVARHMWSREMLVHLAGELYQVDALTHEPQLLALVGTIPVDPMRARLYETLHRNWQDGPTGVESTGLFDQVVTDPGILVVLKMMPRSDSGAADASRLAPWLRKQRTDQDQASGLGQVRAMVDNVEAEWMRVTGQAVLRLSERFEAAALAKARQSSGAAEASARRMSTGSVSLPFELHTGARVVTEYELTWPHDVADATCGEAVGPIRVHHVRIEEQNRYAGVFGYYRHQIPGAVEHLSSQGAWFDGLIRRPESGTQVSLDVVINRDRIRGSVDNEREKLRIDVLMVEIFDPSQPRQAAGAAGGERVSSASGS